MNAPSGMGFPRASLLLLVTLPGCGLFLDTTSQERRDAAVDASLDAPDATEMDAFRADDAYADDAHTPDAHEADAYRDDAYVGLDAPGDAGRDAGRDGGRDASFDASFDGGTDAFDMCASTFCAGRERSFSPVLDVDVSENGDRIALLTVTGGIQRAELYRLMAGATWMPAYSGVLDATCHHVAVSDVEDTIGVACSDTVRFVGVSAATVDPGFAIASAGRYFAVTSRSGVRVYSPPGMVPITLPVGAGLCSPLQVWPGSFLPGLAMRSVPSSWSGCDTRPNLVAGINDPMLLRPNAVARLDGTLAECVPGACCSTPASADVDSRHGTDISVLRDLVVSASDTGRARFVGPVQPQVRDRGMGTVVSVSLGAARRSSHFVLGSIHVVAGGNPAAWLQQETADPVLACGAEVVPELEFFRVADTSSLTKIRISDCDASGHLTAAVLEMPIVGTPGAGGTAHVFRVQCPSAP